MTPQSPMSRPGYFPPPPPSATEDRPIPKWVWFAGAGVIALLVAFGFAMRPVLRSFQGASSEAHGVVDALHAQMRAKDLDGIFTQADPAWRAQVGRPASDELFKFVDTKLGAPQSSTLITWNQNENTRTGTLCTWVFSTMFEKGTGTETVIVRKSGGKYRLLRYSVQSPLIAPGEVPAEIDPRRVVTPKNTGKQ